MGENWSENRARIKENYTTKKVGLDCQMIRLSPSHLFIYNAKSEFTT